MKAIKILLICLMSVMIASTALATKNQVVQDSEAAANATLWDAIGYLLAGDLVTDTLELTSSGGAYGIKDNFTLTVPIVIIAQEGLAAKPMIQTTVDKPYSSNSIIDLQEDLTLNGIIFDGHHLGTADLDSIRRVFRVAGTETGPNVEPDFKLYNCDFKNVYQDGSESVEGKLIEFAQGASAGVVDVQNCTFTNFGDEVFNAGNAYKNTGESAVTPAHGGSFSELTIKNSTFNNVDGSCIKLCGDADSTTVDGVVLLENITFNFCQRRVIWCRDLMNQTVRNIIIANSKLGHETFGGAEELVRVEMIGSTISHIDTFNIVGIKSDGDTVWVADECFVAAGGSKNGSKRPATLDETTIYGLDPMFADADNGDFTLDCASPVRTLAHDGGALGDLNWEPVGCVGVDDKVAVARGFKLSQNYPNPFNPTTTIQFDLQRSDRVKLTIYDILGAVVETLVDSKMSAGSHTFTWDASEYSTGVYFYNVTYGDITITKKMLLLK